MAQVADRSVVKSWTQLLDYCRIHIGHNTNEEFHVLFMNNKLELIADERQQKGTINHTPVYPREVVKRALELGAASLILCITIQAATSIPAKPMSMSPSKSSPPRARWVSKCTIISLSVRKTFFV